MKQTGLLRRCAALALSAALLAGMTGTALAADRVFQDVAADSPYAAAVETLAQKGVVQGTGGATFAPDTALNAAQLAAFLARIAGAAVTRGEAVQALAQLAGQSFHHAAGTGYQTVTSAQDWGPAISKVILSLGTDVDPASVTADKFQVLSDRIYDETSHVAARTVTSAYVSDAQGNQAESGSYVTLELKIGPDETAGSPFNYEFATSGHNVYVITLYYISLTQPLTAADVHYSLFDKVEDTTGLYFQADGVTPYEYMGHWSWLYTLNNQCVDTIGGREVTLFDWLSQQSK